MIEKIKRISIPNVLPFGESVVLRLRSRLNRQSAENRVLCLEALVEKNAYLASQCCKIDSDKKVVYECICNKIATQKLVPNQEAVYIILALYSLQEYESAKEYITEVFNGYGEEGFLSLYREFLRIGFENSKNQLYFLCHCFSAQDRDEEIISTIVFSELTDVSEVQYKWQCVVDKNESYYPILERMIRKLLKQEQYKILYNLMLILEDGAINAKRIICEVSDASSRKELIEKLPSFEDTFKRFHEDWSAIYERIEFELKYLQGIHNPNLPRKLYGKLYNFYPKHSSDNQDDVKDMVTRYLFLIAMQQSIENIENHEFSACKSRLLTFAKGNYKFEKLLDEKFISRYFEKIDELYGSILKDPEKGIKILRQMSDFNIWNKGFPEELSQASSKKDYEEYISQKKQRLTLKNDLSEALSKFALVSNEDCEYFFHNTCTKVYYSSCSEFLREVEELRAGMNIVLDKQEESVDACDEENVDTCDEENVGTREEENTDTHGEESIPIFPVETESPQVDTNVAVEKPAEVEGIYLSNNVSSEYSYQYSLEGTIYEAFKIPAGKYRVKWLSVYTDTPLKVYIDNATYAPKKTFSSGEKYFIVAEDEFIVLDSDCSCELYKIW